MKKIILIFFLLGSITSTAQQVNRVLDSLLLTAQFDQVIQQIDQLKSTDGVILNKKVEALVMTGKLAVATDLLKSIESNTSNNNPLLPALIQANYGILKINQGLFNEAIEHLQTSLSLYEIANASTSLEAAKAVANLGFAFKSTGKEVQAEQQMLMALSIRKNKLPDTHELIAATYNDLGFVYSNLDNDKALEYYDLAKELYEKLHGQEHPKIAINLINTGIVYQKLELYGDAITNFESALTIWEKLYPNPHPQKAFTLLNLGETYKQMRDLKAALGYYERAQTMFQQTYGNKHPDLAYVHNVIGNILVAQEKFDLALSHYQQALIANVNNFNSNNIESNPSTQSFYNGNVLLYSLMYKAQALEARYFGKTLKQTDLDWGLAMLLSCDSLIDRLRQQTSNESDKLTLGAVSNEIYADGVRIAYTLSEVAFKKKNYAEQAFYFAEKSKSAVLLEAISDANAKSFAKIPEELLDEEKNLKTAVALIQQKLAQKPSPEEEQYLREAAFSLDRDYQSFIKRLEKSYPEYFNLKYNAASPTIDQLQQRIGKNSAIISYFLDDKNNRLYKFVITKNKFKIINDGLIADYDKYITGLRNSITYMDLNTYTQTAQALYKMVVPKIQRHVSDLLIIPTGRMSVIPFEALLTTKVKKHDFTKLPYLVRKASIRYEFSAGLVMQKEFDKVQQIKSIMLCAPVSFPEKDKLMDLPGTEKEVKRIAELFEGKNIQNRIYLAEQANEGTIKTDNLNNYNLVHFATHGVVDEVNPELSRIFLQTSSNAEDGNLFTGEIYNLELNANLVTLSACETGLGKISKGEGVIGLSRALVYAGAKSIIVSFWSVADESTAQLMMDFYKQMLDQPHATYSRNLQQTKLDFINGKYAAPYYWAPFILIGF
jgi:CHAT domain-containing protein